MKSWTPPTNEMIERALSSVKKETDRQYFFSRLNNPLWVGPLNERGYFKSPPRVKQLPDGLVQFPYWPELTYLVAVAGEATDQIIDILLALPETDNPRVYDEILEIALKLESQESAKLLPKLIEYTNIENQFLAHRYPELLQHWTIGGNFTEALEIIKRLIPFREDPKEKEKQQLRKKSPNASRSSPDPSPRFRQHEYQNILEKGVRPLAEHKSYEVAKILIDATSDMIRMKMHSEHFDKVTDEDYSEYWCRRLDKPERKYQDEKETLVNTLTFACDQVYEKSPDLVEMLNQILRNQRWKAFKRLRQQLYATHPNDQTLPWIREFILGHEDYSNREFRYEFQFMVRKASEHFGHRLLSEDEVSPIFDAILKGPSKENFHEWLGDDFSEEAFEKRRHYFHLRQLRPFETILTGEHKSYFNELKNEVQEEISDDTYSPFKMGVGGAVSYQSPRSTEELEKLTDDEVLAYINDWKEEHHDKGNWLIEINISALADVFQFLFREKIVPDAKRLTFWSTHRDKIARPVYIAAMVKAMQQIIKERNFDNLVQWIEFGAWVLSHPESERTEGQAEPRDESRAHPDWGSSRRAVVDFIDVCVSKDTATPITARDDLASLLQQACSQFDWRLDRDHPVLLNRDDPITEAINNTRSRAIESLVNFGFWIRRQSSEDPVPEVTKILSKRIAGDAEIPLSRPERALLGMHFTSLCALNRDWAIEQKDVLFPQGHEPAWSDAFQGFIGYNQPFKATFEILRGDFEHALQDLSLLSTRDESQELVDRLGQHLFAYYLWQIFPLTGEDSLLACFYEMTSDDRQRWSRLFDHVGWAFRNSDERLDQKLVGRAKDYLDWRLTVADTEELKDFSSWLEARCFAPEWRLAAFSRILDIGDHESGSISLEVKALNGLLSGHLSAVVECFAKLMKTVSQNSHFYVLVDDAKPILKAGLSSDDPQVRENAESARESLLKIGRFDFLDME